MILSKAEKVIILQSRVAIERMKTLTGYYKSYSVGERKIRKMQDKIRRLQGEI